MTVSDLNPKGHPTTQEIDDNLSRLAAALSHFEDNYPHPLQVNSGYRTEEEQLPFGHAGSAHCLGLAVDLHDPDGVIYDFCIENVDLLIELGLYVEQRAFTPLWAHLQIRPTLRRFFVP